MVLNVIRQVTTYCRCPLFNKTARFYGVYDPPYLKRKEFEIPVYPVLNIKITGYQYPLLENYQSFISKIGKVLNITIEDSFAFPHTEYKIKRYKRGSTVVDSEYDLKIYERDVQVSNVSTSTYPIFLRILEATLPEGVSLSIDNYDPSLQEKRLIPNKELLDAKAELNQIFEDKHK